MGKSKKKHSKKDDLSDDILDAAALSIRKFRKVSKEISKLSTGQKLVGGVALVAAGLTYLASRETSVADTLRAIPGAGAAEALLAKLGDQQPDSASPPAAEHEPAEEDRSPAEPRKRKKVSRT